MKSLHVKNHAAKIEEIHLEWLELPKPTVSGDECLIEVVASGINPSDALATMGYFKHAQLPRIPGRDFAGIVIEGPREWMGKKVFGTGGAAGISFHGTQAEFIKLPINALAEIPKNLDLITAGAQPLPYVTAYYSLVKRARIAANESVLVVGALGQVGRAAMSISQWQHCHPIALVRGETEFAEARALGWNALHSEDSDLSKKILEINRGKPIDVILNSVGNIYWDTFMSSLNEFGRIVTIGARENFRDANINLFELYRKNQEIIGINTVSLDFIANAKLLNELRPGFESEQLIPLEMDQSSIYTPDQATKAYQAVMQGSIQKRVVISFK